MGLSFDVEWDGITHHLDTQQSDVARVEVQFGKSFGKISDETPTGLFLALAYYRLKHNGVPVPGTFDEFLDGDPEIDMETIKDAGKVEGSTNEIPDSTGS